MTQLKALDALIDNYQEFDIGVLQSKYDQDKTVQLVKRPVPRYSYALMRASLNVFVQHNFADHLNALAFDRDTFRQNVQEYVRCVWPQYLEEAQSKLSRAKIQQLNPLEFFNWEPGGACQFGAWHRFDFFEFKFDLLFQISNPSATLGKFEGLCYLENDLELKYAYEKFPGTSCHQLGCTHLQNMTDEILDSLGISPESAIAAIKWQMRG
jgi:hypothetical protein